METVQQNGRFTLFSSKFLSLYSILYAYKPLYESLYVSNHDSQLTTLIFSKILMSLRQKNCWYFYLCRINAIHHSVEVNLTQQSILIMQHKANAFLSKIVTKTSHPPMTPKNIP